MRHFILFTVIIAALSCLTPLPASGGVCDPAGDSTVSLEEVICELQVLTGVRTDPSYESALGTVEGYLLPVTGGPDGASAQDVGGIKIACHYGDNQMMTTVTDPEGFFRFSGVPAGSARIEILGEDLTSDYFQVGVEGNKTIAVNLDVKPVPVLLKGGIQGIVRGVGDNGDALPLQGVVIRMSPVITDAAAGEPDAGGENPLLPFQAETDASGRYEITEIPAGHYMVSASRAGYKKILTAVQITGDHHAQQDFALFPAHPEQFGTLFGSVAEATPPDPDMLPRFIPVPGVEVRLAPVAAGSADMPLMAVTSEKGRFMVPKAPVGDYRLSIAHPDFAVYERQVRIEADIQGIVPVISPPESGPDGMADSPGDPGKAALFDMLQHAETGFFCIGPRGNWHIGVNFVRIVLKRNNPEEKAGLKGLVFFPEDGLRQPVPHARVILETFFPFPTLEPLLTDDPAFAPLPVYEASTDADGIYRIEGIPAGEYHIRVDVPDSSTPYGLFDDMIRLMPGENQRDIALTKMIACHETASCPGDSYCARPAGECAGAGMCRKTPDACPDVYEPVCGCDSMTYGNECEAAAKGMTVAYWGECLPPGETAVLSGRITDGAVDCAANADCIAGIPDAVVEIFHLSPISSRPPFQARTWTDEGGYYKFLHIPLSLNADGTLNPADFEITVSAPQYAPETDTIILNSGENIWNRALMPDMPCAAGDECGDGRFCAKHMGDCEGPGFCMKKPDGCNLIYDPVCGCDGNTYGNGCEADAAGVSVRHLGGCEAHP